MSASPTAIAMAAQNQSVPTRIAAAWGAGTFATTTILNGIAGVLLFYLVNYVKMEPVVAGALVFGAKLLDVFVSPPVEPPDRTFADVDLRAAVLQLHAARPGALCL